MIAIRILSAHLLITLPSASVLVLILHMVSVNQNKEVRGSTKLWMTWVSPSGMDGCYQGVGRRGIQGQAIMRME